MTEKGGVWNVHREQVQQLVAKLRPALLILSPPCATTFRPTRRLSRWRSQAALELAGVTVTEVSCWNIRSPIHRARLEGPIISRTPGRLHHSPWHVVKTITRNALLLKSYNRATHAAAATASGLNRHLRVLTVHYHHYEPKFTTDCASTWPGSAISSARPPTPTEVQFTNEQRKFCQRKITSAFRTEFWEAGHHPDLPSTATVPSASSTALHIWVGANRRGAGESTKSSPQSDKTGTASAGRCREGPCNEKRNYVQRRKEQQKN